MATIAKAVGVVPSTVSKALRGDPTITPARRREIEQWAQRLGYRPDPLVSALMARLHHARRRRDPHHLAWIDLWPDEQESARTTDLKMMLGGATARAHQLGYEIAVYHAGRDGLTPARLRDVLRSRCEWGLIIPPVPKSANAFRLDLEGLTAVTIGTSLHAPIMHRVASNLFQGSQLACRKLRERGFRRVGLAITPDMDERVEGKWLGAFLAEQARWPADDRVPPYLGTTRASYLEWLQTNHPDVVLAAEIQFDEWRPKARACPAIGWLRQTGMKRRGRLAIDTQPDRMGAAAVELVVGQIHRNERGSPPHPNTLLLDGIWLD